MDDLWQPIPFDRESAEHLLLTCPLCGFKFPKSDSLSHHDCSLGSLCDLARCPDCEHEFPERLPGSSWLRRLFHGGGAAAVPPCRKKAC